MAWYEGATKMELQPESDAQPAIRPTQVIFHSIVAPWTAARLYEYWKNSTNLESHFGLGYAGDFAQYIGTETRADANAQANRRPDGTGAISVETASNTSASDKWRPAQVEKLIRVGVWAHERHGIPLRICRSHSDPGFGVHRMFPQWSVGGTACPGNARFQQFHDEVFPGIVARANGQTQPPEEDVSLSSFSVGMTHPFDLDPGSFDTLENDTEYLDEEEHHYMPGGQVVAVDCAFSITVQVEMDGLPAGALVGVQLVEDNRAGDEVKVHDPTWLPCPGDGRSVTFAFTGKSRHRVKFRVGHLGASRCKVHRTWIKGAVSPN